MSIETDAIEPIRPNEEYHKSELKGSLSNIFKSKTFKMFCYVIFLSLPFVLMDLIVRFLTFEEDGRGCFWTDNEKGRPFRYEMDSAYSCAIAFDDGGKASFGLYADQGGALPDSEEGFIWLALNLDDEVLWCY